MLHLAEKVSTLFMQQRDGRVNRLPFAVGCKLFAPCREAAVPES
jgi:hypothetical protein